MFAAYVTTPDPAEPLSALQLGDRPEPEAPAGWTTVEVKAASLNHHDLFSLRGVGLPAERCPMILGCDASGIDEDGNEVIVHGVVASPDWIGDETLDPKRSLLSERYQGTFAERVAVPRRNLLPKPAELSHAEASCLGVAWLTAYRMLFVKSGLRPGQTVLVQGASGGVATAAITLGAAAGIRVWVTGRTEAKRAAALELGAAGAFEPGARLPERVDAVLETVGAATWDHSLKSLRPGGTIVVSGSTTGPNPPAALNRVFFLQLSVVGSTMGTRDELASLASFLVSSGIRPVIGAELPLTSAAEGFAAMAAGDTAGKIVFRAG
ncbi:MAG TPA: zinc-binding dehydrogenase [Mycobacteriales bacterium]|jgi:NADPH:quinone reductase-like Zn-dependent oxidoreductase|nr:zinc-binding dehydrogenase [Mycobacteriales bacterium]